MMSETDITKMAMALMLVKRADEVLKKVDGDTRLLNKADYNAYLKVAKKLITESEIK